MASFASHARTCNRRGSFVIANVGMVRKDRPGEWRRSGHYVIVVRVKGPNVVLFDPKDGQLKRIDMSDLFSICSGQTGKTRGLVCISESISEG
jgi:hypothetical protein